jgi:hypothetical protein
LQPSLAQAKCRPPYRSSPINGTCGSVRQLSRISPITFEANASRPAVETAKHIHSRDLARCRCFNRTSALSRRITWAPPHDAKESTWGPPRAMA